MRQQLWPGRQIGAGASVGDRPRACSGAILASEGAVCIGVVELRAAETCHAANGRILT